MNNYTVILSKRAIRDLRKVPAYIVVKLQAWVDQIDTYGLEQTRTISGYHDEPLAGIRKGQRSIRLNKAYRAFYHINHNHAVRIINVLEVNKHEY